MQHRVRHDDALIARLALEDGSIFTGRAFGAVNAHRWSGHSVPERIGEPHHRTVTGEVVFNTAMTGYQEAITDPSYAGQILVMTTPMIGNYGVNEEDEESPRPQIRGLVVRELARRHSNYRARRSLSDWLAEHGIPAIEGIDTRALVRLLRDHGAMRGVIAVESEAAPGEAVPGEAALRAAHHEGSETLYHFSDDELIEQARNAPLMSGANFAAQVGVRDAIAWTDPCGGACPQPHGGEALGGAALRAVYAGSENQHHQIIEPIAHHARFRILALDCGGKHNIYRMLTARGCEVEIAPHDMTAADIRAKHPDGLFISNGPGDPAAVAATIDALREVAGEIPTFGICLGHQLLALALGARTYKLKFGHRGANQPVRNEITGRVEITSQNHGFCVDEESLAGLGIEVTHRHLNDHTVAGFRHRNMPVMAVQFHPEASPGPHDAAYLFDEFIQMMETARASSADAMQGSRRGGRDAKLSSV